jgi:acid stress chaperone HdeB
MEKFPRVLNARETGMSRLGQSWFALSFMAFAASPAGAQVTVDFSKITCEEYILYTVADPHDIAMWLNGYYNGKRSNTVLDAQEFREHAKKIMDYCEFNLKSTLMDAAQKVLGVNR